MFVQPQVFTPSVFMYKFYQIIEEKQCSSGKEKGMENIESENKVRKGRGGKNLETCADA